MVACGMCRALTRSLFTPVLVYTDRRATPDARLDRHLFLRVLDVLSPFLLSSACYFFRTVLWHDSSSVSFLPSTLATLCYCLLKFLHNHILLQSPTGQPRRSSRCHIITANMPALDISELNTVIAVFGAFTVVFGLISVKLKQSWYMGEASM